MSKEDTRKAPRRKAPTTKTYLQFVLGQDKYKEILLRQLKLVARTYLDVERLPSQSYHPFELLTRPQGSGEYNALFPTKDVYGVAPLGSLPISIKQGFAMVGFNTFIQEGHFTYGMLKKLNKRDLQFALLDYLVENHWEEVLAEVRAESQA